MSNSPPGLVETECKRRFAVILREIVIGIAATILSAILLISAIVAFLRNSSTSVFTAK